MGDTSFSNSLDDSTTLNSLRVDLPTTAIVIGDLHFKHNNTLDCEEFIDKTLKIVQEYQPVFVVLLGDLLDTHEIIRTQPYNLICNFIFELSKLTQVFVIIGNHDYINNSQYLTNNHPFNPLKKWKNITIVDRVIIKEINNKTFTFCPYIPPGKFLDALNMSTDQNKVWEFSDCIFAHQEFYGCVYQQNVSSTKGDKWQIEYPPIISGHIHHSQTIDNIYYPGSAMQVNFGDESEKRIWSINFDDVTDTDPFLIEKIDLELKSRVTLSMSLQELQNIDLGLYENNNLRIIVKCLENEKKIFTNSDTCNNLKNSGVKIIYNTTSTALFTNPPKYNPNKGIDYISILKDVVYTKYPQNVHHIYEQIVQ